MASQPWDSSGNARRALQGIVRDPHFGAGALSQPAVMSNLLKDLLPDEPREAGLLVAAAQSDLAGTLRGYAAQGMDPGTAIRLTAASFVSNTSHTPEACSWVVTELAVALGMDTAAKTVAPGPPPGAGQPTVLAANLVPGAPQPAFRPAAPGQPAQAPPAGQQPAGQQPAGQPGLGQPAWQQAPWQGYAGTGLATPARSPLLGPGIVGLAGAFLLLLGCVVPYVKFSGQSAVSLFGGFQSAPFSETFWFAIEPGGVMAITLVISILLLARGRQRSFFAGLLAAFGVQTILLFAGYVFVVYSPTKREAGGVLGLLAGVALIVAGLMARSAAGPEAPQPAVGGAAAPAAVSPGPY